MHVSRLKRSFVATSFVTKSLRLLEIRIIFVNRIVGQMHLHVGHIFP